MPFTICSIYNYNNDISFQEIIHIPIFECTAVGESRRHALLQGDYSSSCWRSWAACSDHGRMLSNGFMCYCSWSVVRGCKYGSGVTGCCRSLSVVVLGCTIVVAGSPMEEIASNRTELLRRCTVESLGHTATSSLPLADVPALLAHFRPQHPCRQPRRVLAFANRHVCLPLCAAPAGS